jgi:hypothetical protein
MLLSPDRNRVQFVGFNRTCTSKYKYMHARMHRKQRWIEGRRWSPKGWGCIANLESDQCLCSYTSGITCTCFDRSEVYKTTCVTTYRKHSEVERVM